MKNLILATALFASTVSYADITKTITCVFTEPFYDLKIDLEKGEVSHTEWDWDNKDPNSDYITTTLTKSLQVKADFSDPFLPTYELSGSAPGEFAAKLTMNMSGIDHMSDFVYPLEIEYGGTTESGAKSGCTTDKIKAVEIQ